MGIATVANVEAGIITSEPFLILYFLIREDNANKFADEPELVATAYLVPIKLENFFSNCFTLFPCDRLSDKKT